MDGPYQAIGKGPYSNLDKQVKYDKKTGKTLEIYDMPSGSTDAIAMQNVVDHSICKDDKKSKHHADKKKMIKALDAESWNQRQWDH